ncbi:MAG: TonB family protein [Bacteroidia bacterium]|nr:TonB family protein [Bacteroidia bacterium]
MAANNDIFSKEWYELIFKPSQNQVYGAYELRKNSQSRHFWGLIVAVLLFVFIVSLPSLIRQIIPQEVEKNVSVRMISNIKLEKPKEPSILREVPPPPPLRNTIKFTPPVIKPDQLVAEEDQPISQKEAVDAKAAISNVTYDKGTDDIAAPIATISKKDVVEEPEKPFVFVEQMPQFPGGEKEMIAFIKRNLRYPTTAIEMGIKGTVTVNFVVGKDGKITQIRIIRGIGGGCDEEAVRILEKMPAWSPGRQAGIPVLVAYSLPFRFVLQE